ncbi:FMN reductase [Catenuloplanes nepalensis]|uniref:FMN reductase n=1 Tax=Catenuloplanes nepalensis TaxID=587533 RepID=A0ABT9MYD1_9ACTN|nr:FMN reductase [Catenuloplanes nepalensis]MDP9796427.1 FMN reductase [Catenuloplanes nepalensis]
MTTRKLFVVSAGLSQPSSSRLLADHLATATARELRARGEEVEVRTIELRDHAHDVVNNTLTGFAPGALREVLDAVAAADGLIVVTPTFRASYSGLFKSFFDVVEEEALADKPVLIGATGGTPRHSLVLEHAVRPLFAYLRSVVVPTGVYAASEDWGTGGGKAHQGLAQRIDRAAGEMAALITMREPVTVADPFESAPSFDQLLG